MKILMHGCPLCEGEGKLREPIYMPVNNDNIYYVECRNGHKILYTEQIFKFNQLFEIACNAIIDGYYREAVLSFSASLERFYQTCIETIIYLKHKESSEFKPVWGTLKSFSERQYGAFQILYFHHTGKAPVNIDNKIISSAKVDFKEKISFKGFRNAVAHQGYIPNINHSLEFGKEVLLFMKPIIVEMRDLYLPNGGPGKSSDVFSIIKIREVHETMRHADERYPIRDAFSSGGSEGILDEAVSVPFDENLLANLIDKRRKWRS
jgi:hypothetical protein